MNDTDSGTTNGTWMTKQTLLAIGAMLLAVFVIANDFVAMSVPLPTIENDFDTDVSTVQWVVNAYALIFGVLIVPGGRLADMYGRTRILIIGCGVFALFSLAGALAPNIYFLIGARGLQGIGGAMMWPAILGLVYAILPVSKAGLAGGLVIGVAGIGNAVGPLLGGGLTQALSWRWILIINVPIALLTALITWAAVHVSNPTEHQRIDYLGTAALSISLLALLIALTEAPDTGWTDPLVLALFGVSTIAMLAFVFQERRAGSGALIPGTVMSHRPFLYTCLSVLMMSAAFFAALLYLPQFFQKILDADPLVAGASLLPFMAVFAVASFSEAWLVNKIGMKAVITIGAVFMFVGPLLLVLLVDQDSDYSSFLAGMVVLGIGVGLFYSSVTTAALTALDPSMSSLAGGLVYMFQVAGGAVGLGITTTIFLVAANGGISDGAADVGIQLTSGETAAVRGVVAGTDSSAKILAEYGGSTGEHLVQVVRDSFVRGFRWGFAFVAILAFIGMLIAAFRVGGPITKFGRDVGDLASSDQSETSAAD